jgi:hypothetical protein
VAGMTQSSNLRPAEECQIVALTPDGVRRETFLIFALFCFAGLAFVARWVPETRNRNYLEINGDTQDCWGRLSSAGLTGPIRLAGKPPDRHAANAETTRHSGPAQDPRPAAGSRAM